jgi:hypothetical protein
LKEEVTIKATLVKATVHLKKTIQMKDTVIRTLVEKMANNGVEPLLVHNYQSMLLEKALKMDAL